jgi:hypothetical protein
MVSYCINTPLLTSGLNYFNELYTILCCCLQQESVSFKALSLKQLFDGYLPESL